MRFSKCLLAFAIVAMLGLESAEAATLTWTGSGDGTTFGDDANWSGTATGGAINLADLVDEYVVNDAAANITSPAHLRFRDGGGLTMSDGELSTLTSGNRGMGLIEAPDALGILNLTGGTVRTQFLAELTVTLGGTANLIANGGGNPINESTIDFTSLDATLTLLNETVAATEAEHFNNGKFFVNGVAAVIGSDPSLIEPGDNLLIVSDGASGSIVTAIQSVPEPSMLALCGLTALFGLVTVRRRKC